MRQAKEAKVCDITPKDISPKDISPKDILDDFVIKYHFEGKYKSSLVK